MYTIKPIENIESEVRVPADKSISHRAVIIAALSRGDTHVESFLASSDTKATINCLRQLGASVTCSTRGVRIEGTGLFFPKRNTVRLNAGQSGTTMRILSGVLCGQKFSTHFDAHALLKRRPMKRITGPLRSMGARIHGQMLKSEEYPPLVIKPHALNSIAYTLPVASAQVKSAILFASLYAEGLTKIREPLFTRDHTERMLSLYGAHIKRQGRLITCEQGELIAPRQPVFIPSDFSSAAFFIVLGLLLKRSKLVIKNVNINPTRCGLLGVLKRMGADIRIIGKRDYFEPYADIEVRSSDLKATTIEKTEVPLMIDEIPIVCVAAAFAQGSTVIKGVAELKVKETDRIHSMCSNLKQAGVRVSVESYTHQRRIDWILKIQGTDKIKKAKFRSFFDHRTAMSMIVFGAVSGCESTIDEIGCISKSYPEFIDTIGSL